MTKKLWVLFVTTALLLSALIWARGWSSKPATANDSLDSRPLDVVVVLDVSESMDYETNCFGCLEPRGDDVIANPWPANMNFNPLPDITTNGLCTQQPTSIVHSTGKYLVHEAEHYSRDVPLQGWQFERRVAGQGFWVIQRLSGRDASGTDGRGAYLRPHPYVVYSQSDIDNYPQLQGAAYNSECFSGNYYSEACWQTKANVLEESTPPSTSPYVEYDFTPDWHGETHVWIRAQGAGDYGVAWNGYSPGDNPLPYRNFSEWRRAIYWQVGQTNSNSWNNWSNIKGGDFDNLDQSSDNRGPDQDKWRWLKLGSVSTWQGVQHTLRLYQGSAGFNVDKIIFTDFSGGRSNTTIDEDGQIRGFSFDITSEFKNFLNQNGGKGPAATAGSATREACNICNPVFGQTVDPAQCSCKTSNNDTTASFYGAGGSGRGCIQVITTTNTLSNDLFRDAEPLRSAQESIKAFVDTIDPAQDQLGLVAFSTDVYNSRLLRSELQCLRWATTNAPGGEQQCYNPALNPISYTNVIRVIENQTNAGETNLAAALREGLEELGVETPTNSGLDSNCTATVNDKSVCDRQGTAGRLLILITDSTPNQHDNCPAQDLWQSEWGQGNKAYDCAIYYAREAANQDVTLFTIGVGPGVDYELLTAMAIGIAPNYTYPPTGEFYFEDHCGEYYPAAKPSDFKAIFGLVTDIARNCPGPIVQSQIWPVNGYDNIQPSQPFIVHLENHPPSSSYDIYLRHYPDTVYPICSDVTTDAQGQVDALCSLTDVPPGSYSLFSVVAGTMQPTVAFTLQPVRVVPDPIPALSIDKSGPATAVIGQPIVYTLTVTNLLTQTIDDLVISDTVPTGASYVSGGTLVDQVVRWPVSSLEAGQMVQKSFTVTATQSITNIDYEVASASGSQAKGIKPVTTTVRAALPQISSVTGYILSASSPLIAHLVEHQAMPHDIYLAADDGLSYPICRNIWPGGTDPTCVLDDVPPGGYELYSVVAGNLSPTVAVAPQMVVVLADTDAAQILSLSGYANHRATEPLQVYLANHAAGFEHDVYLKNDSNMLQICSKVKADAQKQAEKSCSLTGVPPGFYSLMSVVHGTIWPPVAVSSLPVEIVADDPAPALTLSKSGPATAAANEAITYTLSISNNDPVPMMNLVITDTLPAGATYLSGGDLDGQVVRWTVASLAANETKQVTFSVKASQTITNSDYGVQVEGGDTAQGQVAVVTTISQPTTPQQKVFLPILVKNND